MLAYCKRDGLLTCLVGKACRGEPIMNDVEFEDWLERRGDNLSQWPDPQREQAQALLGRSDVARALLDEAKLMRRVLAAPAVRAPSGLAERIAARAAQSAVTRSAPAPSAAVSPAPAPSASVPSFPARTPTGNCRSAAAAPLYADGLPPARGRGAAALFPHRLLIGVFTAPESIERDQIDLHAYVARVLDMAHDVD